MKDDDDVDLVIDAWGAAMPDVDFAPLDVVSRLRRLLPQMQRIREGAFAAEGLTTSEFEFLSVLRQQGDAGLTRAGLAERPPARAAPASRVPWTRRWESR